MTRVNRRLQNGHMIVQWSMKGDCNVMLQLVARAAPHNHLGEGAGQNVEQANRRIVGLDNFVRELERTTEALLSLVLPGVALHKIRNGDVQRVERNCRPFDAVLHRRQRVHLRRSITPKDFVFAVEANEEPLMPVGVGRPHQQIVANLR